MTRLCSDVLVRLRAKGLTLATAESLTGGGIGAALTAVAGASDVYKGGVISYVNAVKETLLGVPSETLMLYGAVSAQTAAAMASGVRELLKADIAVSVTGLAGPGGDEFGHSVGTVFIGFLSDPIALVKEHRFEGDREEVRRQTVQAALNLILDHI